MITDLTIVKKDYTYIIKSMIFETGEMIVEYTPLDVKLTKIERLIPIVANISEMDIAIYIENWAPYTTWFAQEYILNNSSNLITII